MSKPRPLYVNAKPPAPQSLNALQAVLVAHAAEQQLKLIPRSNSLVHNDTSVALPIDPKDLRLTAQVVSQPGSVARTLALGTALIPVDVAGRVAVESLIDLNEAALLPQVRTCPWRSDHEWTSGRANRLSQHSDVGCVIRRNVTSIS